jgi:hypothetical protein
MLSVDTWSLVVGMLVAAGAAALALHVVALRRAPGRATATRSRRRAGQTRAPSLARAYDLPPGEPHDLPERELRVGVGGCVLAVGLFFALRLTAWPPHEDETLVLFVGRGSLGGLLDTVLAELGGAPLHFLLAWVVAHAGGGLTAPGGLRPASSRSPAAVPPRASRS